MVALAIVLDVAFNSGGETVVNAADLAERTGMARRTLEPLLQALSRERLLDSTTRSAWRLPPGPAAPHDQGVRGHQRWIEQPRRE